MRLPVRLAAAAGLAVEAVRDRRQRGLGQRLRLRHRRVQHRL